MTARSFMTSNNVPKINLVVVNNCIIVSHYKLN